MFFSIINCRCDNEKKYSQFSEYWKSLKMWNQKIDYGMSELEKTMNRDIFDKTYEME